MRALAGTSATFAASAAAISPAARSTVAFSPTARSTVALSPADRSTVALVVAGRSRAARFNATRFTATLFAAVALLAPPPLLAQKGSVDPAKEKITVETLHKRIAAAPAPAAGKPYKHTIPGSDISYEMAPIPAGEFTMGTPPSEPGRNPDEGPQHKVKLEAFWMGKREITWDEYRLFMFQNQANEVRGADTTLDAISRPTRPYVEMSFGMGINGYPAISMTHHAANKYAQWLSAKTGHFYRLPTEAEWEYACRAGTDTAYSFGNDPAALKDYAVFEANANGQYAQVGTKKPNPWGLHDMHGNVMEWTLDQYDATTYASAPALSIMPWSPSKSPYPHVARGGSWSDAPAQLRCGARASSDPSWKQQDPQLPKSIWYHTDALFLGFRLVRPAKIPTADEMYRYWNNGVEQEP